MSGAPRIEASGAALELPDDAYRLFSPAPLLGDDAYQPLVEACARDGAVAFSLHGEREVHAALLRVPVPWMVLERGGARVAAATGMRDGFCALLVGTDDLVVINEDWDRAPELRGGAIRALGDGRFEGDGWTLAPHPSCRAGLRDWSWAWGGSTIGPVAFWLFLERTAKELDAWLDGQAPLPHVRSADGTHRAFGDCRIYAHDGELVFLRSWRTPHDAVSAMESSLCAAIAEGALGPVSWDLTDLDYGSYLATGADGASLARHLDPHRSKEELRPEWQRLLTHEVIAAPGCLTPDALAKRLSEALGLAAPDATALLNLLSRAPVQALPRVIELRLEPALYQDAAMKQFLDAVALSRRRTMWSFAFSLER